MPPAPRDSQDDLAIVLTDGFTGEEIVVRAGGAEVFRDTVMTDQRIGVARAIPPIPRTGPVRVEAHVAGTDLAGSAEAASDQPRVTIALQGGRLEVEPSDADYGYL